MLSAQSLARLEQLQLATNRRLAGDIAGEHRSTRRGSTLDFADFREYVPGDDTRRIDLHQLARLDVLRVKLYEADEDLVVRILLDRSASMSLHGKWDTATSIVAGIGATSLTGGDAVVLGQMPSDAPPRRFRGRTGLSALIALLNEIEPEGETPFARAARRALAQPGPVGMTVVVSDLLTPDWYDAVSALPGRGSDLLVVQVLADEETSPEFVGDLALVDHETRERIPVSLTPELLARYRDRCREWRDAVRRRTLQTGGRYLGVRAGDDVEALLMSSWRAAGVLR
jgi:uncharacterized protein (DUF58 family)